MLMGQGMLAKLVAPPKLKAFRALRGEPVSILDVGCGNHSPTITKHWFPRATYFGLDIAMCNNNEADLAAMDGYYQLDLQRDNLSDLPDNSFDIVIMAHVIEHITNGEDVIEGLSRKLKPGGQIYIECPSERSLTLPSAAGTLNFYDDPTHVRLYSLEELKHACENAQLMILEAAIRRDKTWMAVGILVAPKHILALVRHRKLFGPALWDWLGFAHFVIARRAK